MNSKGKRKLNKIVVDFMKDLKRGEAEQNPDLPDSSVGVAEWVDAVDLKSKKDKCEK